MGIKLPEGALHEERLRKIESRLDVLEHLLKGDVEPDPVIESEEHSSENETPEEDRQEEADIEPTVEAETSEPADTKQALVEKALSLKESYPKAVKAAPSQIPLMSVEKLTVLIDEAEAVIASQEEE